MNTALSRRLKRLEEPARERRKMEIQFICPVKGVVDSIVASLKDLGLMLSDHLKTDLAAIVSC